MMLHCVYNVVLVVIVDPYSTSTGKCSMKMKCMRLHLICLITHRVIFVTACTMQAIYIITTKIYSKLFSLTSPLTLFHIITQKKEHVTVCVEVHNNNTAMHLIK
jgi:hypothetical protein